MNRNLPFKLPIRAKAYPAYPRRVNGKSHPSNFTSSQRMAMVAVSGGRGPGRRVLWRPAGARERRTSPSFACH